MRVRMFISGRVQGVWFRRATYERATKLALRGWVRNLPDGRVEILAEGTEGRLKQFEGWCGVGPVHAIVEKVESEYHEGGATLFPFGIKY